VAQFWSRKKNLPGMMLETQQSWERAVCMSVAAVMGGSITCVIAGIDPQTREVAIFWYRLFKTELESI
jgi:hypothetical protein